VYHLDLYRIETERELRSLGLEDFFFSDSVVLIEWGERWTHLLPPERVEMRIAAEDDGRRIEVSAPQA
jgi:tRNA threonylcarbamoyladenosine biosynthesis protein TsaE